MSAKTENRDGLAAYLFHQGTNFEAYRYLGQHTSDGETVFRVWAPNALAAYVCGDFCGWDTAAAVPMERITEGGIFEASLPEIPRGGRYKYIFRAAPREGASDGERLVWKPDPYAVSFEAPPEAASIVAEAPFGYRWTDAAWMSSRPDARDCRRPLNIYELHLGSWIRNEDGERPGYRQIADELAPYVKAMGYTHVELLPVSEHPFEGSWGYQVSGFFAPTSRFGSPEDFCGFVDRMHEAGIGVILDWVPAHFPKDSFGLCEFDGGPLYEYQGRDRMEHAGWGTRCFDVGRNEVQSFLISNADYYASVYHADGLRVDAVASMLYLDYDRMPGEWIPNVYGDNRNLEAIAFFKKLNSHMRGRFPQVMMIAEESTAWGGITSEPPDGLGFSYKWNMGWMNDALSYKSTDPLFRRFCHEKLTFPLCYAFSENYILPVSHDEVVHGKKSLLDRTPAGYDGKFADTRAFLLWMMTCPGKKLSFAGNEIGQFDEWNCDAATEWFLLGYDRHRQLQHFVSDLNFIYLSSPELWERDGGWDGFEWIQPDDRDRNIISFLRRSEKGTLLAVINFSGAARPEYRAGVPGAPGSRWKLLISTDGEEYGGTGGIPPATLTASAKPADGREASVRIPLSPLSGALYRMAPPAKPTAGGRKTDRPTDLQPAADSRQS